MKKSVFFILRACLLLFCIGIVAACAKGTYIYLNYRLPAESAMPGEREVSIIFKDQRSTQDLFTPAAAQEYAYFTGIFSLSLVQDQQKPVFFGTHDLPSLFKAAFGKRLEEIGVSIASAKHAHEPVFEIILQEFLIDLQERKWIAGIAYEVNLIKNNNTLTSEKVSGKAQRLKVVGKRDAEKVLEEIFSDSINRLDITKLFSQAGM